MLWSLPSKNQTVVPVLIIAHTLITHSVQHWGSPPWLSWDSPCLWNSLMKSSSSSSQRGDWWSSQPLTKLSSASWWCIISCTTLNRLSHFKTFRIPLTFISSSRFDMGNPVLCCHLLVQNCITIHWTGWLLCKHEPALTRPASPSTSKWMSCQSCSCSLVTIGQYRATFMKVPPPTLFALRSSSTMGGGEGLYSDTAVIPLQIWQEAVVFYDKSVIWHVFLF